MIAVLASALAQHKGGIGGHRPKFSLHQEEEIRRVVSRGDKTGDAAAYSESAKPPSVGASHGRLLHSSKRANLQSNVDGTMPNNFESDIAGNHFRRFLFQRRTPPARGGVNCLSRLGRLMGLPRIERGQPAPPEEARLRILADGPEVFSKPQTCVWRRRRL